MRNLRLKMYRYLERWRQHAREDPQSQEYKIEVSDLVKLRQRRQRAGWVQALLSFEHLFARVRLRLKQEALSALLLRPVAQHQTARQEQRFATVHQELVTEHQLRAR